jgi:hypothetical protein
MKYFTPDEKKPSERTLNIIRQIARAYRVMKCDGETKVLCLN